MEKLPQSFGLEVTKGKFPHGFVKRDTLSYVEKTPSFSYWKHLSKKEFKKIYRIDLNLKQESISYLEKDLWSLLSREEWWILLIGMFLTNMIYKWQIVWLYPD